MVQRLFRLVTGSAALAAAFWILARMPCCALPLLAGALIYVVLLARRDFLWLLMVPALLPLLYLSPWTGRLFLTEFDAVVLLTVGMAVIHGRYAAGWREMPSGARLVLMLFVLVFAVALWRGASGFSGTGANTFANYYSDLNGLRMARGLLWALLLYPAWMARYRADGQRAVQWLFRGISLGVLGVFLAVLRERGVLRALVFGEGWWEPVEAFLNFSTEYRVAALFAQMHTGGTEIDGYLMLVLPITAVAALQARRWPEQLFHAAASAGALYVAVTTFSRGVYLGVGVALLAGLFMLARRRRGSGRKSDVVRLPAALLLLSVASYAAFRAGGYFGLASVLAAFIAGNSGRIRPGAGWQGRGVAAFLALIFLVAGAAWIFGSRNGSLLSLPPAFLALAVVLSGALAGWLFAGARSLFPTGRQAAVASVAVVALYLLGIPALFGFRMEARFSTAWEDLRHRLAHWQVAVSIMDDDPVTWLLGQGVGRFPATYFWRHQQARDVGAFVFVDEGENRFLRFFGSPDVRLGQRLRLAPHSRYRLSLDVRTRDKETHLYMRLCHRQLVQPREWNPRCIKFSRVIRNTGGKWRHLVFSFDSGTLGSLENLLQAPLVFTVTNRRAYRFNLIPQTVLEMDNLSIRDGQGREYLVNGDFSEGIDRWFAYHDQNHLPWHVKNLWVHLFFETGAAGVLLFGLLVLQALRTTAGTGAGNLLGPALFVSLAAFLAAGSFGTLIDSPRIAFLFYFLLLVALGAAPPRVAGAGARSTFRGAGDPFVQNPGRGFA